MPEISRAQLEPVAESEKAAITGVKHLSSYNWIEDPTPTIVVPGAPARWNPPQGPRRVAKDSGRIYIAQNAARHPDSPLEPLFRSLYVENDAFDIDSVNVITDRNNIRKLLSFISPESKQICFEPFTINVEVVQDTAIFCRDETATEEFLGPHDYRGHGHEFEKAYTVPKVAGSTGHHRVITYQFGGLKFLVRHETDGYVEDTDDSCDGVLRMMQGLALAPGSPATTASARIAGSKLRMIKGGEVVPRGATIELKTRTVRKPLAFADVARQLWVSQTPKLVRAYHDRGTFQTPQVEDVAAQIRQWEAANQPSLKKLAWLLQRITVLAKGSGGKVKVRCGAPGDKLVISPDGGPKFLPADLYLRWTTESPSAEPKTPVVAKEAADNAKQDARRVNKTGIDKGTAVTSKDPAAAHSALPTPDAIKRGLDKSPR